MRNTAAMFAMMAAMSSHGENNMFEIIDDNGKPLQPREPIPPKGTKDYFFNAHGTHFSPMRKDECVFKCFAINDKNAKRKFDKWLKNQP